MIIFFVFLSLKIPAQSHNVPDTLKIPLSLTMDSATVSDTSSSSTADEDNQIPSKYFSKKISFGTDSIQVRHLPDSVIDKMKQDDDFWYAKTVFAGNKQKKDGGQSSEKVPLGERTWFQTLFWLIIIGCFAAFIMIYLANSNVRLFRRKPKRVSGPFEEATEANDIFAINYSREIEKAIHNSNYRFAVRLMFLQLLKQLSEKNIIQYKQGKTNFDYLLHLNTANYYQDFFKVVHNYEYIWYGKFEINSEKFYSIKNDFEKLEKRLG